MTRNSTVTMRNLTIIDTRNLGHLARCAPATEDLWELADWLTDHGMAHLSEIERIELAERLTRRRFLIGAGGLLGAAALGACGAGEEASVSTREASDGQYPLTIEHDTGTTVIPEKPAQLVVVGEYALEIALVLEKQPVGVAVLPQIVPDTTSGQPIEEIAYYQEYLTNQPLFVGAFAEPSLEAMTIAQPDLILAYSFPASSKLATFSQIAPTLEYDFLAAGGWQRIIGEVAGIFDAEDRAQRYVADFEQRLTDGKQQLEPLLSSGARVNFVTLFGPDIFLFNQNSSIGTLFERLGMIWALPSDVTIDDNGFAPASLEAIATTEADLAIVHNYGAPPETLTQLTDLLEPALSDRIFVLDYSDEASLGVAGPISEQIFLDRVVSLLTEE